MTSSRKSGIVLCLLVCASLLVGLLGGCAAPTPTASATSTPTPPPEKIKLTVMFAWPSDSFAAEEEKMVAAKFKDKYDITFKPVENPEQTIKTTISSGEPLDLAFYWSDSMKTFVDAGMALDLTPYLDADGGAWKKTFLDGSLDTATIDGKIWAVPITPVYPMILANKDLLDQAGVTLSDRPSWDEFMAACATIKSKLGIIPFGNSWPSWIHRNNLQSVWPTDDQLKQWSAGQISFNDPLVKKALDGVKEMYDKEYCYPGSGALTVTLDQVVSAFKTKKIAMMAEVNFLAAGVVKDAGFTNIQVLSLPHIGPSVHQMAGGANGLMIPVNVKHPEASIEIAKYLTSVEVVQKRVDGGSPVAIKGVTSSDPAVIAYAKESGNGFGVNEILQLSPKLSEYLDQSMPANYIFDPAAALVDLEKLRVEAIG